MKKVWAKYLGQYFKKMKFTKSRSWYSKIDLPLPSELFLWSWFLFLTCFGRIGVAVWAGLIKPCLRTPISSSGEPPPPHPLREESKLEPKDFEDPGPEEIFPICLKFPPVQGCIKDGRKPCLDRTVEGKIVVNYSVWVKQ